MPPKSDSLPAETAGASKSAPVWSPPVSMDELTASVAETEPDTEADESPASYRATPHPRRRTGSVTGLLAVAALVAVGGVAFAIGHATGGGGTGSNSGGNGDPGQVVPNGSFVANGSFMPGDPGGRGTATITGTVVSVSADSITLKLSSGQTVTIAIGSSTTYHSQASASSSDVAAGDTVSIKTSGGGVAPGASPSAQAGNLTATDVTITSN
jgi:hypothetical protein